MWKINSNLKVLNQNKELIFPKIGQKEAQESIRSVSFTPDTLQKLDELRAKYKISRSAIIRILIQNAE